MRDKKTDSEQNESHETGEVVEFSNITGSDQKRVPVNAKSHTGGFSSHVRPELARSAVIYLEQEDPKRRHRQKVVCALNVGDFELRYPANPSEPEKMTDDGRALRRLMWDSAVQTLIQILAETGLNPKFVRNDKNSCRLSVKQDSVTSPEQMPDEFFSMELFYCSEFELEKRKLDYVRRLQKFDADASDLKAQSFSWKTPKHKKKDIQEQIDAVDKERQFFIATTPDPREMDSGLIFQVELFTLKEYCVTKEKLKTILSRYVNELSKIAAAHGAAIPPALEQKVA